MSALRRPAPDLRLYLVTDSRLCGQQGVVATAAEAAAAGVTAAQLRDKRCTDADFVTLGRALCTALRGSGVPLFVDDRVSLVKAIGAAGAHVGQDDMDVATARQVLGPELWLGLSAQTPAQVAAADSLPPGTVDYLGIGPIWPQATKADAALPCGVEGFREMARATALPCVAIGGIDASRVAPLRQAGAAGVAVVSAICGQPDVASAVRGLRRAWEDAA